MAQRTHSISDLEQEAKKNKLLGKRKGLTEQSEV